MIRTLAELHAVMPRLNAPVTPQNATGACGDTPERAQQPPAAHAVPHVTCTDEAP